MIENTTTNTIQKQVAVNIMMNVKASLLKAFIKKSAQIISEARIQFNNNGISLTGMDGSHICLVSSNLMAEDMNEYKIGSDKTIGYNLEDLDNNLKNIKVTKKLDPIIEVSINENNQMEIKVEGSKLSIESIDIDVEEINMDSLKNMYFDDTFEVNPSAICDAIKLASVYSEVAQFQLKDKKLNISTEGSIGECTTEIETLYEDIRGESMGNFAIQFLKQIFTEMESKSVKISMRTEAPLKMVERFGKYSEFLFFLAPRVEEDTETTYEQ